ncbi:MAG TPA: alkaline phosphatase family protein [Candidatus Dormibacteraeota bacterium]|jgi:predicted AlkP superfamily pyrophosphatase or phosphodiesterase|nr:alkaline phosphatase family protein [Candidatus Dormibacteraeota bacterium]
MTTQVEFGFHRCVLPRILTALALVLFLGGILQAQDKAPVLVMVSVDGMKPEYVTHADEHGARVPNLRRFMMEGTYAEGVQGVVPTVTYPSHTTLITGVWPAKHGIYANTLFDPLDKGKQAWYWYAEDLKVPTLYDSAREAGRTTASVQWPVTVGAKVTWDIPEIWRAGDENDIKLVRATATPGLLAEAEKEIGVYRGGIDAATEADEVREKYAEWILEKKRPGLLLLHLLALDHIEHETGPFSPEALAVIERLDVAIGKLRATAERLFPGRVIFCVASDHGFVKVEKQINFGPAFVAAGLITLDAKEKVKDWKAFPWATGGSAAIVLKDPKDAAVVAQVREVLAKLASDPENGIDRVLEADDLHARGGYPTASFFVGLKPGWKNGYEVTGPIVKSVKVGGTHGELSDLAELRSSFFVVGPGVPAAKKFELIDMRDIAPTLAGLVGLQMPSADGKNLLN